MKREFCISSYGVADQGHWSGTNSQQYKKIIHKKEKAHFYVLQFTFSHEKKFCISSNYIADQGYWLEKISQRYKNP